MYTVVGYYHLMPQANKEKVGGVRILNGHPS